MLELFSKDIRKCCGCGACKDICPKQAISMKEGKLGFSYPVVDTEKCIDCGLCIKTCAYQNEFEGMSSLQVFAAVNGEQNLFNLSASGGAFSAIAASFIRSGGLVYGCALTKKENSLYPRHIKVDNLDDLYRIQGSKYVQSDMENIYLEIYKELLKGEKVLFSGTPCQVAALKKFIRKEYSNLVTVDLICHGVPSRKMFCDFLENYTKNHRCEIIDIRFRSKEAGGTCRACIEYKKNRKVHKRYVEPWQIPYYQMFLSSEIYRESCYECKYARAEREGDITLGDYWGIEVVHPEYMIENNGSFDGSIGISAVLVNTEKGNNFIQEYGQQLVLEKSEIEKVAKFNKQLSGPSKKGKNREYILNTYAQSGYADVEKWFKKTVSKKGIVKYYLKIFLIKIRLGKLFGVKL